MVLEAHWRPEIPNGPEGPRSGRGVQPELPPGPRGDRVRPQPGCLGPKSHLERKRKGDPLRPGPKGRPAGWVYAQSGSFGQFRGKSRGQDPGPADFPPIRRPRGNGMRRAKQRARLPLPSNVLARGETRGHLQKGWRACPGEHLQLCHANLIEDALEIGFEEFEGSFIFPFPKDV